MKLEHFCPQHHLLTEPEFGRAKRIRIWSNGENDCFEFNINPKNFRSWLSILHHVTETLQPKFGAVRKLLALSTMKFVDSFEDLDPSEKYVALGTNCRFKVIPGGYKCTAEKEPSDRKKEDKKFYSGEVNYSKLPFLIETKKKKLTIVYIAVNGRNSQVPQKVVFKESEKVCWDLTYKYLSKMLDIPEGVRCICTIFGDILKSPKELQHGFLYVAVPFKETFVKMDYFNLMKNDKPFRSNYTLTINPGLDSSSHQSPKGKRKSAKKTRNISNDRAEYNGSPRPVIASIKQQIANPEEKSCGIQNPPTDRKPVQWSTIRKTLNKNVNPLALRIKEEIANSIKSYEKSIANIEKQIFAQRKKFQNTETKFLRNTEEQLVTVMPPKISQTPNEITNNIKKKERQPEEPVSLKSIEDKLNLTPSAQHSAKTIQPTSSEEITLASFESKIPVKTKSKSQSKQDIELENQTTNGIPANYDGCGDIRYEEDDKIIKITVSINEPYPPILRLYSRGDNSDNRLQAFFRRPSKGYFSSASESSTTSNLSNQGRVTSDMQPVNYKIWKNINNIKEARNSAQGRFSQTYKLSRQKNECQHENNVNTHENDSCSISADSIDSYRGGISDRNV